MTHLFLIRGLPGSGKTSLGRRFTDYRNRLLSADDFFETYHNGRNAYRFDPTRLSDAHQDCQDRARRILQESANAAFVETVCVANTFSQVWELAPYIEMHEALPGGSAKNRMTIIDLFDGGGLDDAALAARCVHGVPVEKIAQMRVRWEHSILGADRRPPRLRT